MSDHLSAAIKELLGKLKELGHSVIETKKAINLLRSMRGEKPLFTDTELKQSSDVLKSDQYYGKPLATAAREYLEYRDEACTADSIFKGLQEGGFDFVVFNWNKSDRLRIFSMSLAKNTSTFHRLPNGTYGLAVWYPDLKKPKIKRTKAPEEEEKIIEEGNEKTEKVERENEN